jgi:hypothetical protein
VSLGPVLDAALAAQNVCIAEHLPFCIIGGVALQRWGEPRFTADVDLSVLVAPGTEARIARQLLEQFTPRIADAEAFAVRSRVVLAKTADGVGLDIVLAGLPFETRVVERATLWQVDSSRTLRTCSAEDLIVMKAFAGRDKDWADVTSTLERQGRRLDLALIRAELEPLVHAKEAPELADELERRIAKHL